MFKILFAALSLHAAPKALQLTALEVYENVLKAQARQASLECDIVREVVGVSGTAQSVTGTLKVASGGKAWLEMTVPSHQLAVSDGKALYVEMSDVKQVMKYDAEQLKKSGNFFLDLGSSIRYYAKASLKRLILPGEAFDEKKSYALELMPLNPASAGFDRMRVWVDKDGWVIRQVELRLGGVDTRVRFEKIQVLTKKEAEKGKKPLPSGLFKYTAPKGYEVFDLATLQ